MMSNFMVTLVVVGFSLVSSLETSHRTTYSCSNQRSSDLEPITSMLVISSTSTLSNFTCPAPYELIQQDLNEGTTSESHIFVCITRGDASTRFGVPLTDLSIVSGSDRATTLCPDGSYRIGQDLNAGAGGDFTFFCRSRFGAKAITDLKFVTNNAACPRGYDKLATDLNSKTGSAQSIYACVQQSCDVAITAPKLLNHRADGTFKIAQFTDSHYGENYDYDIQTATLIYRSVIQIEDPDLVALTGDQVSGGSAVTDGGFAESYYRIVDTLLGMGYSYFYTTGNHDPEGDLSQKEINALDLAMGGPVTFTQLGPANVTGGANFYLPVYEHNRGAESVPASALWVFDSNQYTCNGHSSGWGCIYTDQIDWYKSTAAQLKTQYGGVLPPANAYFHIPLDEYLNAHSSKGECQGRKDEGTCCPLINSGAFEAFKEVGDVYSTHVGHDHDNDFGFNYQGIYLYYGRKSGNYLMFNKSVVY